MAAATAIIQPEDIHNESHHLLPANATSEVHTHDHKHGPLPGMADPDGPEVSCQAHKSKKCKGDMHTEDNFIAFDDDCENNKGKGAYKGKSNREEHHDIRAELEAFYTMLLEAFQEVDLELAGIVTVEQLGSILDDLHEDGAINYYDQNDLQLLGNDMDSEGSGYVYITEFIDVLFRREQGYIMSLNQRGQRQYTECGQAPMDFTFEELEEAFKVFDVAQRGVFGKKEIRAVLKAVADTDVSDFDACKMIEGASLTPGKDAITFEEFKAIMCWSPPVEHADGNTAVEPRDPPYLHE